MAISPLPQAPYRQDRKTFPTPLVGDVLFSEIRDCNRIHFPEFGTPHYNPEKWPHHKLVFIKPVDIERNEIFEFFYAADRENQDLYNWSFTDADIGGTKFKAVTRSYVVARDSFIPSDLPMGTAMENIPADLFTGSYVLAEHKQQPIEEPTLASLYVLEQRTYVQKVSISEYTTEPIIGTSVHKTTTLYYRNEEVLEDVPVEDLFNDPSNSFWGIQTDGSQHDGQQLSDNWFAIIKTDSLDAALENYVASFPMLIDLQLPNVLEDVVSVLSGGSQAGVYESNWNGQATGKAASLGGSERGQATASVTSLTEASIRIRQPYGNDLPATIYFFYIKSASNIFSKEDFKTKLESIAGPVNYWPVFHPESVTVTTTGSKVSVTANVDATASASYNQTSDTPANWTSSLEYSQGQGASYDISGNINTTNVPPTLHKAFNLTTAFDERVSVRAQVSIGISGEISTPTMNPVAEESVSAFSSLKLVCPATVPPDIPKSGLYITKTSLEPYRLGWAKAYAVVLDASIFA